MNEHIHEVLNEISDKHIAEAATKKRGKRTIVLRIAAAAAALAVIIGVFQLPRPIMAQAVSLADDCRISERPDRDDYKNMDDWRAALNAWDKQDKVRTETTKAA